MIDFDSYLVYAVHPEAQNLGYRLAGKYLIHDGTVHVVSDHDGVLDGLDGQRVSAVQGQLRGLTHGAYYAVIKKNLSSPHSPDQEEEALFGNGGEVSPGAAPEATASSQDGIFRYHRQGHDSPRSIEVRNGVVTVDGQSIPHDEVRSMLDNVTSGMATLERVMQPDFAKSARERYAMAVPLKKSDLNHSFEMLRGLVQAGHLHPDHYEALRRELYQDEMVPELGNKKAYRDFVAQHPGGGVHVMLDGNGMKAINDTHGHEAGDHAIVSMGQALRQAIDTAAPGQVKAHRFGGDEFHFHAPTPEVAHHVLRAFRENLDQLPPIKGTHKLSMSAGVGHDPKGADEALYGAKAASKQPGAAPTSLSVGQHPSLTPAAPPATPTT